MNINDQGLKAVQQLRIDLQETTGIDYPHACFRELLLLHDLCVYLELSIVQTQEILGPFGFLYVDHHINQPITLEPNATNQCREVASLTMRQQKLIDLFWR